MPRFSVYITQHLLMLSIFSKIEKDPVLKSKRMIVSSRRSEVSLPAIQKIPPGIQTFFPTTRTVPWNPENPQ